MMTVQNTSWLTLTNILLGAAVVLCALIVAVGACCGVLSELKKRRSYEAELDRDMDAMFALHPAGTALHVTGTGSVHRLLQAICRACHRICRLFRH